MGTNSAEYRTLIQHTADIQLAVKTQLVSLGARLVEKSLITRVKYGELRNDRSSEANRAADLVQLIQDKVEQSPQCYHTFITALQGDEAQNSDILQKLQDTFKITEQDDTSASLSTVLTPSPRTATDQVITAEGQVKQVLEKEVTCPLCLDILKEPKKLHCDHVYCKECLRCLALRSLNATISCPECRTLTQPPNNDVNNFPTAFRVNRLIEAFQRVQVREETDSFNRSDICHTHPTQPLALYCEMCNKLLCRDCVLMQQDHANHKYSFFKEVAPRYRKELLGELSLIKNQELSISNSLREIAAVENSVDSYAEKCPDDIDRAFEEMLSVLQECKQTMKVESAKHFSALRDTFECQKKYLKEVQSEMREVVISVNTSVEDDDQNFLRKLESESTMMRIKNLKEKLRTAPLTITKPMFALQVVSAEQLQHYMSTKYYFTDNLSDPKMCTVEGTFLANAELQVGNHEKFILTLNDSKGQVCQGDNRVEADLVSLQGISTKGKLEPVSLGQVKIILTPQRRGQHKLGVKVNGVHIMNSPFSVMVTLPPKLVSQPVKTISGLGRLVYLIYFQGKVLATEQDQNSIVSIMDSQPCTQELIGISGVAQDTDLNLYVTTTKNKLYKLSSDGKCIETIGQLGTRIAFNFPNGLRVSKNRELYVCDSGNDRMQIFDLDLNFKRSFGTFGNGNGQFKSPMDVCFDSSGNIYITDCHNDRIQVFTSSEYHIRTIIGRQTHCRHIKFDRPISILIHNNHIYVTNYSKHNVVVISMSGEIIATFGDGYLSRPEGITVDKDGFVYVTSHKSRVVVF